MVKLFRVDLNKTSAHQALRQILSDYLGQAPGDICFEKNPNGKLLHPKIFFSLSHSRDLAVIAVNRYAPIGVDIEQLRVVKNEKLIAKRFFSPQENPEKTFLEIWTAKEALVKAHGNRLVDHIHKSTAWDFVRPILSLEGYVGHLAFQTDPHGLEAVHVSDFII